MCAEYLCLCAISFLDFCLMIFCFQEENYSWRRIHIDKRRNRYYDLYTAEQMVLYWEYTSVISVTEVCNITGRLSQSHVDSQWEITIEVSVQKHYQLTDHITFECKNFLTLSIWSVFVSSMTRGKQSVFCTAPHRTEHTLPPTRQLIPLACKQIIPYLYVQSSSWRWTLGFETRRRHHENYNINLTKVQFVGLYYMIIL